jgi:DNA repair ATPase RecN
MDPKYTDEERANRSHWKQQATEAQANLEKIKYAAVQREKREREEQIARDHAKRQAEKAAAEKQIQARGLVEALTRELGKLERTHGVRVTSHESSTTIHGQQTITVQFTKFAAPRTFTPHGRWMD